jgi:hypothetical protein
MAMVMQPLAGIHRRALRDQTLRDLMQTRLEIHRGLGTPGSSNRMVLRTHALRSRRACVPPFNFGASVNAPVAPNILSASRRLTVPCGSSASSTLLKDRRRRRAKFERPSLPYKSLMCCLH